MRKTQMVLTASLAALMLTHQANAQTVNPSDGTSAPEVTPAAPKIPWDGFDLSWVNGNDRRDSSIFHIPYFTPSIMVDCNITHSFNNPNDNTVVGSTALSRDNEMTISAVNFGGDFNFGDAHARIMTQFGDRAIVVPRNDLSVYRGQYDLADAYRYLDEAYAGYHFNVMYGINVDFGLFMSYIGLNSYYQEENWEYQASFVSDNTPWFFNGIRIQIFPSKYLKIEPWIINGWQSYGSFNALPGLGTNITWIPQERLKLLTNDYWGTDAAGDVGRHRFHSDNSFLYKYYSPKGKTTGITKMAFSLTADVGFEQGDGVNGFNNKNPNDPAQYFLGAMFYNKIWFAHNHLGIYCGGGWMTNPGRYLVLEPTGQASNFPNPGNPTQTASVLPASDQFQENPGNPFTGWDCSAGLSWMPNQSLEIKAEWVHRESSVPYFAGPGGVTSPNGYTTTPIPFSASGVPLWVPDLERSESRVVLAVEFRL